MVKKFLRKRSKRVPCARRYRIERKVREHQRKQKKEAKKKAFRQRGRKKESVVVPNEAPFKEAVLQEAAEAKRQEEAARMRAREEQRERRRLQRAGLLQGLRTEQDLQEPDEEALPAPTPTPTPAPGTASTLRAASKDFRAVVSAADVLLQVLDARDPLGTRSPELERQVLSLAAGGSKRLVLVLNKADLVPAPVLQQWLTYLRRDLPTVPFKASTQSQRHRLAQRRSGPATDPARTSACVGADTLMALLGNYCRNRGIRGSITVGVVGMPNVGKSSVINSLKRSRVCNVGATAGVTRTMQTVQLDSKIRLLDSPGIVFASGPSSDAHVALRNALRVEQLPDPVVPASAILQRVSAKELQMHYGIGPFSSTHEFLCLLARKQGRLKRKGVPDVEAAAKTLLRDWTGGKIKYYTLPPEEAGEVQVEASLVQTMAAEFDLEAVAQVQQQELASLVPSLRPSEAVLASSTETPMQTEKGGEKEEGLLPPSLRVESTCGQKKKRQQRVEEAEVRKQRLLLLKEAKEQTGNLHLNRSRQLEFKRLRKRRLRQEKEVADLTEQLDTAMDALVSIPTDSSPQ